MRLLFSVAWLTCVLVLAGPAQAQDKDKEDTAKVREIGGKTLEEWIKIIPSRDRSKAEVAVRTVAFFHPDRAMQAVPNLLAELKKHTYSTPLDISMRVNLAISLGIILGNAKGPDPRQMQEGVTYLSRLLKDSQAIVRYRAVEALGRIGTEARSATTDLIALLKDPGTWEVRQAAAASLAMVAHDEKNGPNPNVISGLYGALNDSSHQVRLAAIQSLTFLGSPANPTLRQSMIASLVPVVQKDPDPTVQIWAHMSLMSLTENVTPKYIQPIVQMTKHPEVGVRLQAIQALGVIGSKGKNQAVPALINCLADSELAEEAVTVWALARIGVYAADAIPHLQSLSVDAKKPEALKKGALEAIDYIQGKKKMKS